MLGLLAVGCPDSGGGPGLPASQLGAQYASAFCRKAFTCCDTTELPSHTPTMVDEATCRTMVAAAIDAEVADNEPSVAAGRAVYHGDRAQRCLDALNALPCEQWGYDDELDRFPDCVTVFTGTLAPGTPCEHSVDCAGGHCNLVDGCIADGKLGQACEIGSCLPELVCHVSATSAAATCGDLLPDGSPCLYSNECFSQVCAMNAAGDPVCTPPTMCNGV